MRALLLQSFVRLTLLVLMIAPVGASHAQTPAAVAPASAKGYWNLETNLTTRAYTIVRFYNDRDQLVHEARFDSLYLDLSRGNERCHRTARLLDQALQLALRGPATALEATAVAMLAVRQGQSPRVRRAYAAR